MSGYARGKGAAAEVAQIMEREFYALLEHYCDPKLQSSSRSDSHQVCSVDEHQPLVGLMTPAALRL